MDLIDQQLFTESDQFNTDLAGASLEPLFVACQIVNGELADVVKKSLYYGAPVDGNHVVGLTHGASRELANVRFTLARAMTPGMPEMSRKEKWIEYRRLAHAILGKITEVGELVKLLISSVRSGLPLSSVDWSNVYEELGDDSWYNAILIDMGRKYDPAGPGRWHPTLIQEANIRKLKQRYPDRFTSQDALNRDTSKEMDALTGQG